MTGHEIYKIIRPLLEAQTEGLYWDFKRTLHNKGDIIRDILAFSNSNYTGDSYIIVGVGEPKKPRSTNKIKLSTADRQRLNTQDNYLYLPAKWELHGLTADDIEKMQKFSKELTDKLESSMLITHPKCEFVPVMIKEKRWLYVIIIKHMPGVFISNKDILDDKKSDKIAVKQGVLYVRVADITIGAEPNIATATEHIRVWKNYIDWITNSEGGKTNE